MTELLLKGNCDKLLLQATNIALSSHFQSIMFTVPTEYLEKLNKVVEEILPEDVSKNRLYVGVGDSSKPQCYPENLLDQLTNKIDDLEYRLFGPDMNVEQQLDEEVGNLHDELLGLQLHNCSNINMTMNNLNAHGTSDGSSFTATPKSEGGKLNLKTKSKTRRNKNIINSKNGSLYDSNDFNYNDDGDDSDNNSNGRYPEHPAFQSTIFADTLAQQAVTWSRESTSKRHKQKLRSIEAEHSKLMSELSSFHSIINNTTSSLLLESSVSTSSNSVNNTNSSRMGSSGTGSAGNSNSNRSDSNDATTTTNTSASSSPSKKTSYGSSAAMGAHYTQIMNKIDRLRGIYTAVDIHQLLTTDITPATMVLAGGDNPADLDGGDLLDTFTVSDTSIEGLTASLYDILGRCSATINNALDAHDAVCEDTYSSTEAQWTSYQRDVLDCMSAAIGANSGKSLKEMEATCGPLLTVYAEMKARAHNQHVKHILKLTGDSNNSSNSSSNNYNDDSSNATADGVGMDVQQHGYSNSGSEDNVKLMSTVSSNWKLNKLTSNDASNDADDSIDITDVPLKAFVLDRCSALNALECAVATSDSSSSSSSALERYHSGIQEMVDGHRVRIDRYVCHTFIVCCVS